MPYWPLSLEWGFNVLPVSATQAGSARRGLPWLPAFTVPLYNVSSVDAAAVQLNIDPWTWPGRPELAPTWPRRLWFKLPVGATTGTATLAVKSSGAVTRRPHSALVARRARWWRDAAEAALAARNLQRSSLPGTAGAWPGGPLTGLAAMPGAGPRGRDTDWPLAGPPRERQLPVPVWVPRRRDAPLYHGELKSPESSLRRPHWQTPA